MRHPNLALAALTVLAAACGGNDQSSVTTTSGALSPSSTAPTTTIAPECDDAPAPADTSPLSESSGDVDGDLQPDALSSYLVEDTEWHLHVELAGGGGADLTLAVLGSESVAVLGGADVDGDGAEEVWASTGAGASATIIGLARFVDCSLTQVTFAGGTPAEFPIGGSVGTASGLECANGADDASLTAYTATNTGEGQYDVEGTEYALEGNVLLRKDSTTTSISNRDPAFARATGFVCGSLTF